jgi:hypothetical protein
MNQGHCLNTFKNWQKFTLRPIKQGFCVPPDLPCGVVRGLKFLIIGLIIIIHCHRMSPTFVFTKSTQYEDPINSGFGNSGSVDVKYRFVIDMASLKR